MTRERNATLEWLQRAGFWFLIILILIFTLFPFYWALNSSFKGEQEIISPATFFPKDLTLINYESVFSNDQFLTGLANSAVVSGISVLLEIGRAHV